MRMVPIFIQVAVYPTHFTNYAVDNEVYLAAATSSEICGYRK